MDEFIIRFEDADAGKAGSLAESLRAEIRDISPTTEVRRVRENPQSMDPGTILEMIVASSAASAIANGVAIWIARNSGVKLTIKSKDGSVSAEHVNSKNAGEMVTAVFGKK